ncbi:hypothetical protein [Streptomyces sp. AS02]|uniref:hypothetical protein n=1 Tax=Streptomyces sp. AS02 TaxID=2938946 RepID=UPI00201FF9AB|nr:hypothetical protein [Streptomyces sp. AS02]MCL8014924.1 hypothetical protein [Streptomyces sp. AS02]
MRNLINRFTAATLAAGALCVGLAFPTPASAADVDAVQLRVCNNNSRLMTFFVVGYNQYRDWTGSQFWEVQPNSCATAWNYWWQVNRSVEFHYQRSNIGWHYNLVYIPSQGDGGTWTYSIS